MDINKSQSLPAGMVELGGERMTVEDFFRLHGADLAACPDAEIAIQVPASQPSEEIKDLMKGSVNAVSAIIAVLVLKNPSIAKAAGTIAGTVAGGWASRNLGRSERVSVVKIRDLMGHD